MALTGNTSTPLRDGKQFQYGVKAGVSIHQGALLQLNGGYVEKAAGVAGKKYVGIAMEPAKGGSADGDAKVLVRRRVAVGLKQHPLLTARSERDLVVGDTANVEDDETVRLLNDVASDGSVDRSPLGDVVAVDSGRVWVFVE